MFNFLKKNSTGTTARFKITGMHCTSCSMNIDGELEDTKGVFSAATSYAKGTTEVIYDNQKISANDLAKVIEEMGYTATIA